MGTAFLSLTASGLAALAQDRLSLALLALTAIRIMLSLVALRAMDQLGRVG